MKLTESIDRSTIDILVKIIKRPLQSSESSHLAETSGLSSTGKGVHSKRVLPPITRPLICICNDIFAPSLRELKQLCSVFVFRPIQEAHLMHRLGAICSQEAISIHPSSLSYLSKLASGDIRSAINTLQFTAEVDKNSELNAESF